MISNFFIISFNFAENFPDMISYYFEDIDFKFKGKAKNNAWLKTVAESEVRRVGDINIIGKEDGYQYNILF